MRAFLFLLIIGSLNLTMAQVLSDLLEDTNLSYLVTSLNNMKKVDSLHSKRLLIPAKHAKKVNWITDATIASKSLKPLMHGGNLMMIDGSGLSRYH